MIPQDRKFIPQGAENSHAGLPAIDDLQVFDANLVVAALQGVVIEFGAGQSDAVVVEVEVRLLLGLAECGADGFIRV